MRESAGPWTIKCPKCGAEPLEKCLGARGKDHAARIRVAENRFRAKGADEVKCPICLAEPGEECRGKNGRVYSHGIHAKRKEAGERFAMFRGTWKPEEKPKVKAPKKRGKKRARKKREEAAPEGEPENASGD